jgi:hypothetical protein
MRASLRRGERAFWPRTDLLNINITSEVREILERLIDFPERKERPKDAWAPFDCWIAAVRNGKVSQSLFGAAGDIARLLRRWLALDLPSLDYG